MDSKVQRQRCIVNKRQHVHNLLVISEILSATFILFKRVFYIALLSIYLISSLPKTLVAVQEVCIKHLQVMKVNPSASRSTSFIVGLTKLGGYILKSKFRPFPSIPSPFVPLSSAATTRKYPKSSQRLSFLSSSRLMRGLYNPMKVYPSLVWILQKGSKDIYHSDREGTRSLEESLTIKNNNN